MSGSMGVVSSSSIEGSRCSACGPDISAIREGTV